MPIAVPVILALIKKILLCTLMKYYQYIRVLSNMIPQEVWDDLGYTPKISANGYVYIKIRCGMYGLKEAAIIALYQLVICITPHGY